MALLYGVAADPIALPRAITSGTTVTAYVYVGVKPPVTCYVQQIGTTQQALPKPTTLSISPASFGFTIQNQTQQFTATVKDQFGNILTGQTIVWASSDPSRVSIDSGTGVAQAIGTGANATITATVQNTSVTATASATTPATTPTTLTVNAGFATLEQAAAAQGIKVGFSFNVNSETHQNYSQQYQQTAGAAGFGAFELWHNHWFASGTAFTGLGLNGVALNFLGVGAQEIARLQSQGINTLVTTAAQAVQMAQTMIALNMAFFVPKALGTAYSSATTYHVGDLVSSAGANYLCIANGTLNVAPPNTAVWLPYPVATITAWNSGTAYVPGNIVTNGGHTYTCWTAHTNQAPPNYTYWIKTEAGVLDTVIPVNEPINNSGYPNSNKFQHFTGWSAATLCANAILWCYAADQSIRKFGLNAGHGEKTTESGNRTNGLNLVTGVISQLSGIIPASKIDYGYEGHLTCSAMQTSGGSFDKANFVAWLNSISATGASWSLSELDVTDDMLIGQNTPAAITQRQQLVGLAYQNLFAALATTTAKPDRIVPWQLRCPESWLQASFPRSDGLTQYPNLYLDFLGTEAPAFTPFVNYLTNGLGLQGSIVLSDGLKHQVPATLKDQWGAVISLSNLTWSSSNPTGISVDSSGEVTALSGGQSATITATYAPTSLTATVSVSSAAAALTALSVQPSSVTLASGTTQLTASEIDQYGNAWAGGGSGAGGVWTFTSSGKGLAGAVTAITSASNQLWMKMRLKVDPIRALGTWTGAGLVSIDSDGAGTNMKFNAAIGTNGSGQFAVTCHGWGSGGGSGLGGPVTPFVNISALPATGNYVIVYVGWDQTNFTYYAAMADANGTVINDGTNSCSNAQAANFGALATTGGAVTVNKNTQTAGPGQPSQALIWDGLAVYTNTPPAIGSGLTATSWSKPTTGDAGLAALWLMGDATSGTISTGAASFGGQNMALTACTGGLSDASGWSSSGAAVSLTWKSDNTAAATVNSTGLVSAVAPGVANVQAAVTAQPTVTGTSVVTVQTTPVPTTLTVNPTSVTLTDGQTVQIAPTVLDQFGQPYTGATTVTYGSSNTGVATVSGSGLVTAVASTGTCTVTTTLTSVTPNLTATTQVTDGTSAHANEPAGMTRQIDWGTVTTLPVNGQNFGATASQFQMYSPATPTSWGETSNNLSLVPTAQGTGLRITYPPNVSGGFSPVRFGMVFPATGGKTMYVYFKIRYSPNWSNNGNVGTKITDIQFANSNNGNHENDVISGTCAAGSPADQFLTTLQQNQVFRAMESTANLAGASAGTWHTVECLYTPQTSANPATADGTCTMWMDGTQVFTATNVSWVATGDSQLWSFLLCDATYGGGSNSPPNTTPNIYWDWDQLYVSTK